MQSQVTSIFADTDIIIEQLQLGYDHYIMSMCVASNLDQQ